MKIKIEKLDHFGRGIAHIDGKICFIKDALPEEIIDLKITKETKKYYLGEAIDYIELSSDRIVEKCQYFHKCGGCHLEHFDYQKENLYKEEKVKELFQQFTRLPIKVKNIEYNNQSFYRNKVTLHGSNNKLGYYKQETNELIEVTSCNLLDKKINMIIPVLQNLAKTNDIKEAIIRVSNDKEMLMIKLTGNITNINSIPGVDVLIINDKVLSNNNKIITSIGDKKYYLSADSFFQVNKYLTEKLYDEVKQVVENEKPNTILDLYCGTGTIGIYVAKYAKKVIGIDYSRSNINDAKQNMTLNNINNIEFICDKVENIITNFSSDIDLIIVDPPRAGLDKKTLTTLKNICPKTIIYVSCDPATLARDLKELSENYIINYVKPFNMFPRTYHVECVCVLKLLKSL